MRNENAAVNVMDFVDELFGADLHAKRVASLANATTGVLRAGVLGIHAIGRGLAAARGTAKRHSVKQVDRLVGNGAIDVPKLLIRWIPFVVAQRTELVVALDWTDFAADGQATVVASLISSHGRTTPLAWMTVWKKELSGETVNFEEQLLRRVKDALPETVKRVTIIADRGFGDAGRWNIIKNLGFDYVVRIRADLRVTDAAGEERAAHDWVTTSGRPLMLKNASITAQHVGVARFVATRMPGMKEAWLLVTSLEEQTASSIVNLYGRRFTIEESFRDIKDLRFGMGLKSTRVSSPDRRDRLLLLSALTIVLLTLLGAAGEQSGIVKHYRTNTSPKRQLSLFRQGCEYYEFFPTMRDEWAAALLAKFSELIAEHRALTETLAVI